MQGDWTQDIKVVLISPCYSWLFLQGQRWGRNLEETPFFLQIKPLLSKTGHVLMLPELSSTTVTALFFE